MSISNHFLVSGFDGILNFLKFLNFISICTTIKNVLVTDLIFLIQRKIIQRLILLHHLYDLFLLSLVSIRLFDLLIFLNFIMEYHLRMLHLTNLLAHRLLEVNRVFQFGLNLQLNLLQSILHIHYCTIKRKIRCLNRINCLPLL